MNVELVPTLFDQYRETMEGTPAGGWSWIIDNRPGSALFATLDGLTAGEALAAPTAGAKSIAAHVAHLAYTLDVTAERLAGQNPTPDWPGSFRVADATPAGWEALKQQVRRSYETVLAGFSRFRDQPLEKWPPIVAVGLSAMIAHNAYHLAAIRQIAQVVRQKG